MGSGIDTAGGETDLQRLLASLEPTLDARSYGFATVERGTAAEAVDLLMRFEEAEGSTWVLPLEEAQRLALPVSYPCRRITLAVHSSLAAVGLLAAVTGALAARGISVNPVSAFHHDHLFVPTAQADAALSVLRELSAASRASPGPS